MGIKETENLYKDSGYGKQLRRKFLEKGWVKHSGFAPVSP